MRGVDVWLRPVVHSVVWHAWLWLGIVFSGTLVVMMSVLVVNAMACLEISSPSLLLPFLHSCASCV